MTEKKKNLSEVSNEQIGDVSNSKIAIVKSKWNPEITNALNDACVATMLTHGVKKENIVEHQVPGSFELPAGAQIAASKNNLDAIICIGCVITGETKHDEYISNAVAMGCMQLGLGLKMPVIFGLLTPRTMEQAIARAGGEHGNKGVEAAITALEMITLQKGSFGKQKVGF
ncbi:UNVERIFIED_CONTAM: hypothetical protein GTU68_037294 [Idotea baltica]|nr:hypothetical protein [Idotea baltica]